MRKHILPLKIIIEKLGKESQMQLLVKIQKNITEQLHLQDMPHFVDLKF